MLTFEFETEAARREREQRSEMLKELTYMGYKFEQYMCAVVNTNEAFCTVIRSRLGSHSLLFSGEVDCTDPRSPSPQPPSCYVELKTSKVMHSPAQRRSFYRHKIIKWWAQSFLPGVSRIVAGYRGPDGSVVGLETFETMKIFTLIRDDPGCWKPAVCMNFCAAFLAFLKTVGTPVSFTVHQDSHYRFLPDWYVEALSAGSPPHPDGLTDALEA
ncbi:hypothetical protein E2320_014544 [Naja naja]|nr:hypothetical protein E2320_014544 [Naja naja]